MGSILSRSVMIHISNKTQNITLKNPRTYFDCGQCPAPLLPELSPGSSDTSNFPSKLPYWGVAGLVVYEAESFTLAVHFSNSIDYRFATELGLELSPGKAHLGSLEDTYTRMANGTYSSSDVDIKFSRAVVVDRSHGTVQVSDGRVKVTATMSDAADSVLRVVLEEQVRSGEEAQTENPRGVRHYQEK